jgi:hypothetical protein
MNMCFHKHKGISRLTANKMPPFKETNAHTSLETLLQVASTFLHSPKTGRFSILYNQSAIFLLVVDFISIFYNKQNFSQISLF